jgi:hypothetical protein
MQRNNYTDNTTNAKNNPFTACVVILKAHAFVKINNSAVFFIFYERQAEPVPVK